MNDLTDLPFSGPQPFGMAADLFLANGLSLDDDRWIPQAAGVWFKPLLLSTSQGYYVNLLRVEASGTLSRHHHFGPVHAFTLRGTWRYLEHDWVAKAGDYVFEPAGETHTLVVPDVNEAMVVLFHVTGGYSYIDPQGAPTGHEDVFTKLAAAKAHYESNGWPIDELMKLVR